MSEDVLKHAQTNSETARLTGWLAYVNGKLCQEVLYTSEGKGRTEWKEVERIETDDPGE